LGSRPERGAVFEIRREQGKEQNSLSPRQTPMNTKLPFKSLFVVFLCASLAACGPVATPVPPTVTAVPLPAEIETVAPLDAFPTADPAAQEQAAAEAAVRAFAGQPDLALTFTGLTSNAQNTQVIVQRYESADAFYEVDLQTFQVVTMEAKDMDTITGPALAEDELARRAREFMLLHVPCFERAESYLRSAPGSKGGENYFFRWEYPEDALFMPGNLALFIQLSMKNDGRIYHFTDAGVCRVTLP
jgi:hypothetical protein